MTKKTNKIFISYQYRDKDFAEELVKVLQTDYEISWVNPSIEPGTLDWMHATENAIIPANFVVALFSSVDDYDGFRWNLYELGMAAGGGASLILVLKTKIDFSDIPSPIRKNKIIDASGLSPFEVSKKISETLNQL